MARIQRWPSYSALCGPRCEVVLDRGAVVGDHRVDAQAEVVRLRQLLEQVEHVARLAGVVEAGQSPAIGFLDRVERGARHLVVRERRNDAVDERHARCRRTRRSARRSPCARCVHRRDPSSPAVTPAARIAAAFTRIAWPSTRVSTTGLFGDTRSARRAWESACRPTCSDPTRGLRSTDRRARSFTRAATRATTSSYERVSRKIDVVQIRAELEQVRVRVDHARG